MKMVLTREQLYKSICKGRDVTGQVVCIRVGEYCREVIIRSVTGKTYQDIVIDAEELTFGIKCVI